MFNSLRHAVHTASSLSTRNVSSQIRRLEGKVAAVTASTDGIGLAIARRLGQEGAKVMISSRKEANVQKAVADLRGENLDIRGCVCHVGKDEDRTRLLDMTVKEFGKLDILVSNAAVNPYFGDMLELLDINVKAAFLMCKEAVPLLEKTGGNIVINTSIVAYTPNVLEPLGPYAVCKTALLGLIKALVSPCSRKNIRVNGIAPGIIKTNFSQALWQSEETEKMTASQVPLRRLGRPEDCAGVAAFLASDDAGYVTGETIVVAGGMTSHL